MDEPQSHVGARVREVRSWRGLSLETAAGLSGMTKGYLSKIENGRAVPTRAKVEAIADALRVAPSDLTAQPLAPMTRHEAEGHAAMPALRAVLRDIETGMLDVEPGPDALDELAAGVDHVEALSVDCDYGGMGELTPGLIADAWALAETGSARARMLLIHAHMNAFRITKNLGYHDLSWSVARHLHDAAQAVGDPRWIAIAEFRRAHAMTGDGSRARALRLVGRAADALTPDDGPTGEVYGLLRLSAAFQSAVTGRHGDVPGLLDEASEVAARTGEGNFAGQFFGPRNVGVWRVALEVETGDLERVPELAREVDIDALPSANRRASFYADLGRGLAARRGREQEATAALAHSERTAPQWFHHHPYARETVAELLRRARRDAGGVELRGLAYRCGMAG